MVTLLLREPTIEGALIVLSGPSLSSVACLVSSQLAAVLVRVDFTVLARERHGLCASDRGLSAIVLTASVL